MLKIVAHTRSGTHYLAALLHANMDTGHADYAGLDYSHSRVPTLGDGILPYICIWRQCLPTMLSIWRSREHLGIASSVTFSDMLRTDMSSMPRSSIGLATYNGTRDDRVCAPREFKGMLLERWYKRTVYFANHAFVVIRYDDAVARPFGVVQRVAQAYKKLLRKPFVPVTHRVGWQPVSYDEPHVTPDDYELIERYEKACLANLHSSVTAPLS